MGKKVENRNCKRAQTTGHNHEPDLTNCGIGQNLFDVRLSQGNYPSKYRGSGTNNENERHGERRKYNQRTQSH